MPKPAKVGFEATGGQEWALWSTLGAAGIDAVQLPPAQIKALALSQSTRAKSDRIDGLMRNSSLGSRCFDQTLDGHCRVRTYAFSEPL